MKPVGYILCILLLFNTSCSKDTDAPNVTITGKWDWVSTDGGIFNHIHDTPASTGRHVTLELTARNYFYLSVNGVVKEEGPFTTRMVESIYGRTLKMLDFYPGWQPVVEYLTADSMSLADNTADGTGSLYVRIRP